MKQGNRRPAIKSLTGLVQSFRRWARGERAGAIPEVRGASEGERHLLSALGGLAAAIADERVSGWPEPSRQWAEAGARPPSWLIEGALREMRHEIDVLALLYNSCVSPAHRRELGTVFTPRAVVAYMLELATRHLDEAPRRVVDPGAGVGAFTLAAARRWPQSTVEAVDLNPVTLGLLATRIAYEIEADPMQAGALERVDLICSDYVERLAESHRERTLTIGNPPYTRAQSVPIASRRRAKVLAGGMIDSGHANLAVLFQAVTFSRMRDDDVSCLILPASFVYTRASRRLREALWNSQRPIEVHRWGATERAFIGHSVQAAILLVGPRQTTSTPIAVETVRAENGAVKVLGSRTLDRGEGEPVDWSAQPPDASQDEEGVGLSAIARIRRGVATGANSRFFVDDALAARLPTEVVVPGVPSLRGFNDEVLDDATHAAWGGPGTRRWLLVVPRELELSGRLEEYVESMREEVEHRHLPSLRACWYSISPPTPPAILLTPLAKNDFKVVVNRLGAIPSNNLFGIYPADQGRTEDLAQWLRSKAGQRELRRVSIRYPGGSYKLEPRKLGTIRVPRRFTSEPAQRGTSRPSQSF